MGLFGPSKNEIWKALSEEIQGAYSDGGIWKGSSVSTCHGNWTLTLDTYTQSTGNSAVTYTRMRTPFVNPSGFRLRISRQGAFSELGRLLGTQDVELGIPEFDDAYILKGNDEDRIRQVLSNERLRRCIMEEPKLLLEIRPNEGLFGPKFKDDESELHFLVLGVVKDIERLKRVFDLFTEMLDTLANCGVASACAPEVLLENHQHE